MRAIKLSRLLKKKIINLSLKGKNKKEVIKELVKLIALSGKIKDKKKFYKSMIDREKLGSTGIGNGVAIPHAKSESVKDFTLVCARTSEGIDFGAIDGEKSSLFFALASPVKEVGGHLKILAEISRVVKDKFIVELLKKAKNKDRFLKIIQQKVFSLTEG